jgi:hypothetical protein
LFKKSIATIRPVRKDCGFWIFDFGFISFLTAEGAKFYAENAEEIKTSPLLPEL